MHRLLLVAILMMSSSGVMAKHALCPVEVRTNVPRDLTRSLDQNVDTLRHDDNVPRFVFRYPDAFGDDFRNQRFRAPQAAALIGALFVFPTRGGLQWTTGDPALITIVWASGEDSLPVADQILLRDTLEFEAFSANVFDLDSTWQSDTSQVVFVDLSDHSLALDSALWFHLGYSAIRNSDDDSLAILSDDGIPETDNASEYFNGSFVSMRSGWRGVNFFIRAVIETEAGEQILSPYPQSSDFSLLETYPNPFNAATRITYVVTHPENIRLQMFDVTGRLVAESHSGFHPPGTYQWYVAGNDWSSGAYFVRLYSPSQSAALKILLEK